MEFVYFKTKTSELAEVCCTADGRINFAELGQEFGFNPASIKLNGTRFDKEGLISSATWAEIKNECIRRLRPDGTQNKPVIVAGEPAIPALSTEGEPLSKKTKRSPDEFQFSVPAEKSELVARQSYFEKLLEAPLDLPRNAEALREFLSAKPIKLPVLFKATYAAVGLPEYVDVCTSKAEMPLASEVEHAFNLISYSPPTSEATSSSLLFTLTGTFLQFLDRHAPANSGLLNFSTQLGTTGATGSSTMSALQPLERPDFLGFVKEALILRWENKFEASDLRIAMEENSSKLCVWSPLYYGSLPYVIGGCCGGQLFRWLKLSPNGKEIAVESISEIYDWKKPRGVALLLHSTIRMHCLLQRLQKELTDFPLVRLYKPIPRSVGGEVTVYPDRVCKTVPPLSEGQRHMLKSLYDSIKGSRYLIQLISMRTTRNQTTILLEPVGDPNARPGVLKDLVAAVHDILRGLLELHKQGYTHRDLRWENFIKVNVEGVWKWMVIDLEAADLDEEEWVGDGLRSWDARTLEDRDGKKIYTKGSDMYQLGKLIVEWVDASGGEAGRAMRARGENMRQERGAAKMLEDICMEGCERCGQPKRGF